VAPSLRAAGRRQLLLPVRRDWMLSRSGGSPGSGDDQSPARWQTWVCRETRTAGQGDRHARGQRAGHPAGLQNRRRQDLEGSPRPAPRPRRVPSRGRSERRAGKSGRVGPSGWWP